MILLNQSDRSLKLTLKICSMLQLNTRCTKSGQTNFMKKQKLFLILVLFLHIVQIKTGYCQEQLKFDLDYAQFRTSSDFIYLEVYYSVIREQLKFVPYENRYRGDFNIEIKIFLQDSLIFREDLDNVTYADSLSHITSSQLLTNLSSIVIKEDHYKIVVKIRDLHSELFGTLETALEISPFSKTSLAISDIQLASRIMPSETEDKFTKNQYQVIPNSRGVYGSGAPILYFYAEVYNLFSGGEKNQYRSKYSVVDDNGDEVRVFQDKIKDKPGSSSVEVSGFNIISLLSGPYFLRVAIEDLDSKEKVSALKKFFVYRPGDFVRDKTYSGSRFSFEIATNSAEYQSYDLLDENALKTEFNGAAYLATDEEKKVFPNLDLTGKRNFLKRFWFNRDADRATVKNEFRKNYLKRIRYVNEGFGSGKNGWKKDRGRVYLIYGEYDEIERFPSSSENKEYEIWNYYKIQGGVIFIFVDIRGFGNYTLVHSTARYELHDYEWQRWSYPQ